MQFYFDFYIYNDQFVGEMYLFTAITDVKWDPRDPWISAYLLSYIHI